MEIPVNTVLQDKCKFIFTIKGKESISKAIKVMRKKNIGSVVVCKKGKPIGLISERDILHRVLYLDKDINKTSVKEVMTQLLVKIKPYTTVREAMLLITRQRVRHLLVMDQQKLTGIISHGDLTKHMLNNQAQDIDDLVHYISGTY